MAAPIILLVVYRMLAFEQWEIFLNRSAAAPTDLVDSGAQGYQQKRVSHGFKVRLDAVAPSLV